MLASAQKGPHIMTNTTQKRTQPDDMERLSITNRLTPALPDGIRPPAKGRASSMGIRSSENKSGPFLRVDEVQEPAAAPAPGKIWQTMNWFFADKNRLFWSFQVAGWAGFFLLHLFTASAPVYGGIRASGIPFSFAAAFVGFLFSSIFLRPIYRFAWRQAPPVLLSIVIAASAAMAIVISCVKAPIYIIILGEDWVRDRIIEFGTDNFARLLLPDLPVNIFLMMSWSGFYFGINYYLALRDETERALFSARLADQAQLKMLRYQLNPHFLFNTLNAISTLVLSQEGKQANAMLTQLSAFLRYSLDSDPLQKHRWRMN